MEGHIYATKNEASIADLPLDPNLAELLLYHKRQSSFSGNSDFIFAGDSGEPRWPDILLTDHIKPAARKVGIGNIGWHPYSTLLHALGTTPAVQKKLLCHVGIQTTMNIYTHAVTPAKREAAFKVVDLLWRG